MVFWGLEFFLFVNNNEWSDTPLAHRENQNDLSDYINTKSTLSPTFETTRTDLKESTNLRPTDTQPDPTGVYLVDPKGEEPESRRSFGSG